MDVQIDNKKMWESLMKSLCFRNRKGLLMPISSDNIMSLIQKALVNQGLKYDADNGEIVSIEPEPRFKDGDWVVYECGDEKAILKVKSNKWGTYEFMDGSTVNQVDEDCLRPATEEEIPQDSQRMVSAKAKECMYSKDNYTDEDRKVLCEDCEEDCKLRPEESHNKSESNELTEFEQSLQRMFWTVYNYDDAKTVGMPERVDDIQNVKQCAQRLYSIARKQIASEIDFDGMVNRYKKDFLNASAYAQGIEDCIKAIEKGDEV